MTSLFFIYGYGNKVFMLTNRINCLIFLIYSSQYILFLTCLLIANGYQLYLFYTPAMVLFHCNLRDTPFETSTHN